MTDPLKGFGASQSYPESWLTYRFCGDSLLARVDFARLLKIIARGTILIK